MVKDLWANSIITVQWFSVVMVWSCFNALMVGQIKAYLFLLVTSKFTSDLLFRTENFWMWQWRNMHTRQLYIYPFGTQCCTAKWWFEGLQNNVIQEDKKTTHACTHTQCTCRLCLWLRLSSSRLSLEALVDGDSAKALFMLSAPWHNFHWIQYVSYSSSTCRERRQTESCTFSDTISKNIINFFPFHKT